MARHTAPPTEISFEEFVEQYTGRRYEYVDGRAVPMGPEAVGPHGEVDVAPTRFGHGKIAGRMHSLLGAYVMQHNLGEVLSAETGFMMRKDPPEMRAADIAFITRERAESVEQETDWLSTPPDLAVEVISEHDHAADTRAKAEAYMQNGTRLLWVVYPKNQVVDVYRPGQPVQTLAIEDALDGDDVVPGFSVPLQTIFGD